MGCHLPQGVEAKTRDSSNLPNTWHLVPVFLAHVQPGATEAWELPNSHRAPLVCLSSGLPTSWATDARPGGLETPIHILPGPGTGTGMTPGRPHHSSDNTRPSRRMAVRAGGGKPGSPLRTVLLGNVTDTTTQHSPTPSGLQIPPSAHEHSGPFSGPISSMTSGSRSGQEV